MTPQTTRGTHLDALTGLRFIAAIHVVLFHVRDAFVGAPDFVQEVIGRGNIGVNLFFVLSGFVLAYNYATPGRPVKLREFWAARVARIYPVYLFAFLLFAPRVLIGPAGENDLTTALTTVTLIQGWTGHLTWNAPGWSLSAEMFFYLVFPAVLLFVRRTPTRRIVVLMSTAWVIGLVPPTLLLGGVLDARWHDAVYYSPLARLPEFVIGVALGLVFLAHGESSLSPLWRWSAWLSVGSAGTIVAVLAIGRDVPAALLHNGLLDPLFAILVLGLAGGAGPLAALLSRPTMKLLGEASYSVYILQSPVFIWFKALVSVVLFHTLATGNDALDQSVPFVATYCAVLVAVSISTFIWVEAPARRAVRQWLSAKTNPVRGRATVAGIPDPTTLEVPAAVRRRRDALVRRG